MEWFGANSGIHKRDTLEITSPHSLVGMETRSALLRDRLVLAWRRYEASGLDAGIILSVYRVVCCRDPEERGDPLEPGRHVLQPFLIPVNAQRKPEAQDDTADGNTRLYVRNLL